MGRAVKLTIEEIKTRLYLAHGDIVTLDESTYVNTIKKAKFIDKDYGEWWAKPQGVLKGSRHKKRYILASAKKRAYTIEDVLKKIETLHKGLVKLDESTYVNAHTKARFIDKDYGEWWAEPVSIFRGIGCKKRADSKATIPISVIIKKIKKIHGGDVKIDKSTYVNTIKKAKFIDKDYGEWWAKPSHILRGGKHKQRVVDNGKSSKEHIENKIRSVHGEDIKIIWSTYKGQNHKALFIDKDYGEWWAKPNNVICGAAKHPKHKANKNQKKILNIIEEIFTDLEVYNNFKGFEWLVGIKNKRMELDIWVPALKLAIEYDGEQHFIPVPFGGESKKAATVNLKNCKKRDMLKNKLIKNHSEDVKYFIRFNYKENINKEYVLQKLAAMNII